MTFGNRIPLFVDLCTDSLDFYYCIKLFTTAFGIKLSNFGVVLASIARYSTTQCPILFFN